MHVPQVRVDLSYIKIGREQSAGGERAGRARSESNPIACNEKDFDAALNKNIAGKAIRVDVPEVVGVFGGGESPSHRTPRVFFSAESVLLGPSVSLQVRSQLEWWVTIDVGMEVERVDDFGTLGDSAGVESAEGGMNLWFCKVVITVHRLISRQGQWK